MFWSYSKFIWILLRMSPRVVLLINPKFAKHPVHWINMWSCCSGMIEYTDGTNCCLRGTVALWWQPIHLATLLGINMPRYWFSSSFVVHETNKISTIHVTNRTLLIFLFDNIPGILLKVTLKTIKPIQPFFKFAHSSYKYPVFKLWLCSRTIYTKICFGHQ